MGGVLFSIDFLDFAFCSHNVESLCHSKKIFMTFALIVSIFITLIESLKPFGYVSIFSTFIIILSVLSMTIYNLQYVAVTNEDLTDRLTEFKFSKIFSFIGLAFYTAEGIGLVLPVRATFKDNEKFSKVFYATFTFIIWVYVVLGILSYIVR